MLKTTRYKVNHINQKVIECYENNTCGFQLVDKSISDNWERNSYEYYELNHNQQSKNGLYGMYIKF